MSPFGMYPALPPLDWKKACTGSSKMLLCADIGHTVRRREHPRPGGAARLCMMHNESSKACDGMHAWRALHTTAHARTARLSTHIERFSSMNQAWLPVSVNEAMRASRKHHIISDKSHYHISLIDDHRRGPACHHNTPPLAPRSRPQNAWPPLRPRSSWHQRRQQQLNQQRRQQQQHQRLTWQGPACWWLAWQQQQGRQQPA